MSRSKILGLAAAMALAACSLQADEGGANIKLFSGTTYVVNQPLGADKATASDQFSIDETDLYVSGHYGDHLNGLAEVILAFQDGPASLDLERIWGGWTVNEQLMFRIGRNHSALGYWNQAYHHGGLLQPSIERPFFLRFEDSGGIIPNHLSGLSLEGRLGALKYEVTAGKTAAVVDDENALDPHALSMNSQQKTYVGRLGWTPAEGLTLGLSAAYSNLYEVGTLGVSSPVTTTAAGLGNGSPVQWGQTIEAVDLTYFGSSVELLAEAFNFNNQADGSGWGRSDNYAAYVHLGWHVTEDWTPYVQIERAWLDQADAEWQAMAGSVSPDPYYSRTRSILGLRWEMEPAHAVLKLETRRDHKDAGLNLAASGEFQSYLANFTFGF